ncbi:GNAT family N-acyltransferase [Arcobacter porcinus]|uniref:2-acyl-glycerophospho-ethanolamine acyltransferase n=1 Tax=Arcobacter porcinus TaxID=1935204 RepID=A0ABX2YCL5_9BACT|nr:lysophospholipid acyltransferase family protein [Arcobacter porcinus]OCL83524.1 2-acyl-glycerophospho-ethanolamine acyltransferase [Arcobacter porcinus]OCL83743.1 2-acyl-glycerophospho-ethanolamine acyltransferase [Arcobacter porcinus]OCL92737.1 2-acyl-glycerophospho-ethanolamine acyltransferase [Arcobacter porcinus]
MINIQKEIENKFPKIKTKENFIKKSIFKIAKKLVHEDTINKFLSQNSHLKGFDFVDAVLDYFDFDYTVSSNDLQNIPSNGKVVIISNHPLGGLDALCLLKLVGSVRKDIKIVANDFLAGFEALNSLIIPIDNFQKKQSKDSIKKIYDSLLNDEALIVFPAGEVSRATHIGIKDKNWSKGFLNFAKNSGSPILPIFIDAKNSKTFYTISLLNKTFSTLLLSNEMFNKKSKHINIKIGQIIPNENILPKALDRNFVVNLYKKHLYALKKGKKSYFQTQSAIAHPVSRIDLLNELKKSQLLGQTNDGKMIYLYDYVEDSIVLKELGRLRELSFRKVGEGVNKKRDTDKYDIYYQHIILYDRSELEIVGAYRIANSEKVFKEFGVKGFYSNSLFEFNDEFLFYLQNSAELGRSFVQPKYWGTRALDYLWFGIGAYLKANPNIKYLFGPVSISGTFPSVAKDLLVYYYSFYFKEEKELVVAKNRYNYKNSPNDLSEFFTFESKQKDFRTLKSALGNIGVTIPTLYKQYAELTNDEGVKFLDFNVDKDFSDCVDGFILVEIEKIKEHIKLRYIS